MAIAPRILIVEDQYFVAADCERHLTNAGFQCVGLANNAAQALELAARHKPDLILMDLRLANNGDGVELAIAIYRKLGIRSVFASAHVDTLARERARAAVPFGWLYKPYTAESLLRAVNSALAELSTQGVASEESADPHSLH
jgi:DNA-binding NarL/FixJ family response regulator